MCFDKPLLSFCVYAASDNLWLFLKSTMLKSTGGISCSSSDLGFLPIGAASIIGTKAKRALGLGLNEKTSRFLFAKKKD